MARNSEKIGRLAVNESTGIVFVNRLARWLPGPFKPRGQLFFPGPTLFRRWIPELFDFQ